MDEPAITEKKPWAIWAMTKDTVSGYIEDNCLSRGASIAYFTVFSLAPILLVMIAIAGFVFGEDAARGVLFGSSRECWALTRPASFNR